MSIFYPKKQVANVLGSKDYMIKVFMLGKRFFVIENHLFCISLEVSSKKLLEISKIFVKYLSSPLKFLSAIASQFTCFNEYIKIDNNKVYYCYFS